MAGVGVAVLVLGALGAAGCSDDEPEAPVPTPVETVGAGSVAEAAGSTDTTDSVAPATEPAGTGLITIDGPATVDSSFSGANPGGG